MRFRYLFAACAFSVCVVPAHAEPETNAPSFNRAQSVINTFQVMCTLELPKFDANPFQRTAETPPSVCLYRFSAAAAELCR